MKIVTGYTGQNHITSNDMQAFNQGVLGTENYVLNVRDKFSASIVDSTHIRLSSGEGVMQGVHFRIEQAENVTIDAGEVGKNRIDLICARYTKNSQSGVEAISAYVIKGTPVNGTPVAPTSVSGDILGGDTTVDFPLYSVTINGLTPEEPVALFSLSEGSSDIKGEIDSVSTQVTAIQTLLSRMTRTKITSIGRWGGSVSAQNPVTQYEWGAFDLKEGHTYIFVYYCEYYTDTVSESAGRQMFDLVAIPYGSETGALDSFPVFSDGYTQDPHKIWCAIPIVDLYEDQGGITFGAKLAMATNTVHLDVQSFLIEILED